VAGFTSTPQAELVAGMLEMSTFDSAAAAARVTCPLLFVGTGPPYSDLPRLRVLCPQLVTAQLVGCGHYFPVECPDQLAATITRFLETQLA
jgi:pimeloyl-ACP methyl ester carboxylesterase